MPCWLRARSRLHSHESALGKRGTGVQVHALPKRVRQSEVCKVEWAHVAKTFLGKSSASVEIVLPSIERIHLRLPYFDQVAVRVTDVRANLGSMLLRLG